jgi:hypothetical protein
LLWIVVLAQASPFRRRIEFAPTYNL